MAQITTEYLTALQIAAFLRELAGNKREESRIKTQAGAAKLRDEAFILEREAKNIEQQAYVSLFDGNGF